MEGANTGNRSSSRSGRDAAALSASVFKSRIENGGDCAYPASQISQHMTMEEIGLRYHTICLLLRLLVEAIRTSTDMPSLVLDAT